MIYPRENFTKQGVNNLYGNRYGVRFSDYLLHLQSLDSSSVTEINRAVEILLMRFPENDVSGPSIMNIPDEEINNSIAIILEFYTKFLNFFHELQNNNSISLNLVPLFPQYLYDILQLPEYSHLKMECSDVFDEIAHFKKISSINSYIITKYNKNKFLIFKEDLYVNTEGT